MDNRLHLAESHIALLQEQMQGLATTIGTLRHDIENAAIDSDGDLEWMTHMSKRLESLEDSRESSVIEALSLNDRLIDLDDRVLKLSERLHDLEGDSPDSIASRLADLRAEREAIWDDADSRSATLSLDEMDRVEEISRAIEELESLGTEGVTIADLKDERQGVWEEALLERGSLSRDDMDRIAELDRLIENLEDDAQAPTKDIEGAIAALQSDAEDMERELFIMGKDLHGLRMQIEVVRDEQGTVFASLERHDDELADLRDEQYVHDKRLEENLETIQSRLGEIAEREGEFEGQIDDLESRYAEIDEIESRLCDVESTISLIDTDALDDIASRVEDLESIVTNLDTDALADAEDVNGRIEDLEDGLRDEVRRSDDAFGHTQALIGDLQAQVAALQARTLRSRLSRAFAFVRGLLSRIPWKFTR